MKKQLAWILGGASIVGLGMLASLNACSSDDSATDAGSKDGTAKDQSSQDQSAQDQSSGDSTPPQDGGADCKTPSGPFNTDSGPFCPFQVGADGGTVFSACNDGEHCCVPKQGQGASTCQANACTFIDSGADFQCNETNDCPNNQICCLTAPGHLSFDLGCASLYDFVSSEHGTQCAPANQGCPTGQPQICGSNADCTGGKTCFPVNTDAIWIGACIGADGGI